MKKTQNTPAKAKNIKAKNIKAQNDKAEPIVAINLESEEPQGEEVENEAQDEEGAQKKLKKCMSEEELQERLAQAKTHYKQFCRFFCTKTQCEELGLIRSARLDKRSGFIQFRIEIIAPVGEGLYKKTGKIFGKGDDSQDLEIFETAPELRWAE